MIKTQKRFSQIRLFQQHVGLFFKHSIINETNLESKSSFMEYAQKIGVKGMSDLYGIIDGRFIAIEVKTGNAKQSKEQRKYEAMVKKMGGIYIIGRSVDQVIKDIENELQRLS